MGFATMCVLVLFVGSGDVLSMQPEDCIARRKDSVEVEPINRANYAVIVLSRNSKFMCSGTILHEEWVLTSAHCMYNDDGVLTEDDESITVIAGADQLEYSKELVAEGKTQIVKSSTVIVHPSYSYSENFRFDLALIKLETPLTLNERVGKAPLMGHLGASTAEPEGPSESPPRAHRMHGNNPDFEANFMNCVFYGFGKVFRVLSDPGDYHLKLQIYEVSKHCHCLERVRSVRSAHNILRGDNQWLCEELFSYTGLCTGDSGGQLICPYGQTKVLRGIATGLIHFKNSTDCALLPDKEKNECGSKNTVGIFSDLCRFSMWINNSVPDYPVTDRRCKSQETKHFNMYDDGH